MASSKDSIFERVLQTLAVAAVVTIQVLFFLFIPALSCYMIFSTKYWWICVLYFTWYLIFDKDASVTGRRRSEWVRSWTWWAYARDYYPLKVVKLPCGELDPKRNYLFCIYPHGLLSASTYLSVATNVTEFTKLFPHHKSYMHTISAFYKVPVVRDLALWAGGVEASKKALEYNLSKKDGGNISTLVVGGAQEAYYSNPGIHKIVLKKRKGFIKIALTQGSPLVPVYSFGENEIFSQLEFDENSIFQKFRELVRKKLGFCIIYPLGRMDLLGLIPKRKPITFVVGEPIDVEKTENPTQEQIDNLHQLFEKKLVELFESQKKHYLKDYENAHLEII
ncbi:2-acylglycerol O-acyltransferase 1-like isoform X2 [Coccinella septempunctata]|uniref:2-acylglycerol O-acyltransferase 1-like isoform X2 n=1 Tax=Coccinella septempunctata TaxID=41139 RepID=UPI001D086355|nr:2-acylglycerol O-acyltransferase 1-like isoform X2 [Coccinella septempunctata]